MLEPSRNESKENVNITGAICGRANELRTDFRAVEISEDLETYISGLEKIYNARVQQRAPSFLEKFMGYPSYRTREYWLWRACAGTETSKQSYKQ